MAQPPRRTLAPADRTENERDAELAHEAWCTETGIGDVMHAVEPFATMHLLGKRCREPLPQGAMQMEWPAPLPAQAFRDVEILKAEAGGHGPSIHCSFNGWA